MVALPYDINTNVTFIGMRSARLAFEDVAAGRRIMCLVSGASGVGKTLEARRALRKAGVPFHEFGVTPSERDLVKLMWFITSGIITHKGQRILVVIADDQDGLARRETILNHLKGMFGSDRRRVTFPSSEALRNEEYRDSENVKDKAKYRATIAPSGFDIDIRLIWLSNSDYTDPAIIATLPSHFHAMVSKGLDPLCIPNDAAHDGRDVFLFTHYLATEKNALGGEGYSYEVARQAVRFYVENVHRLIDIPPRRLAIIAKVIKHNPDPAGRDERLAQMLRDADQRPKLVLPESWVPQLLWPTDPPHRAEAEPIVPRPEEAAEPQPETIAAERVAREETLGGDRGDILVEPVAETQAERGEPLSDIKPPPNFDPDPLDVPLRPLAVDETKTVQTHYDLPKWRGRITNAHALRAAFFKACQGHCPPTLRNAPSMWWAGQAGQLPRAMIAKATPLLLGHAS